MRRLSNRGGKVNYDVTGNVVWLSYPARNRQSGSVEAVASLKRSVTRLVEQIERSGRLKADIAAAIDTRRYELYRKSTVAGNRASDRNLAAAQRTHVDVLLKFVHSIAAAGSDPAHPAGRRATPAARPEPLAKSIRELKASVSRATRLSRDVLAECQRGDWRTSG